MDMITLALAKKYTDEKVDVGSGATVIDLDEWGIDIVTLIFCGGGVVEFNIDHEAFWKSIPTDGNFTVRAKAGDMTIIVRPSNFGEREGFVQAFGFTMLIQYDDGMHYGLVNAMMFGNVYCTYAMISVEQLNVPQM